MKTSPLKIATIMLALAIPGAASAQPPVPQQKYCTALSKEYDRYIASDHGANHLVGPGFGEAACKEHHAYVSIPVLERTLEAAKLRPPTVAQAAWAGHS
jgi:hypothetical protein